MIKVPEIILFNAVQGALKYIRLNYANETDKNNSYLRRVLSGIAFQRYDFVAQAEQVFLCDVDNARFLDLDLMFNMQKNTLPTMYLSLPAEGIQSGGNGIGLDEGFIEDVTTDEDYYSVFTRRFQATYNIVITSDNSNEVILIYQTLKALLISFIPSMNMEGLENINIGGQDITITQDSVFVRAISVSFQYDTSVPNPFSDPLFQNIIAQGTPINE